MFARVASFESGDVERLRQLNEERMNDGTMELPEGRRARWCSSIMGAGDVCSSRSSTAGRQSTRPSSASRQWETRSPRTFAGRRMSVDVYEVVWQRDA